MGCPDLRRILRVLAPLVLAVLAVASSAQAATVAIPGSPMTVFVNDIGGVTARLAGDPTNVFFSPSDNDTPNAGFTLGFPAGFGQTPEPQNYGVIGVPFTPLSPGVLSGAGTASDPYRVTTVYEASDGSTVAARITQVVTHVSGTARFAVSYSVQNVSGVTLRFRAGEYADLYLADDTGTGFLNPGPPRLVGGLNVASGRAGGIEEVAGSPWDRYETGGFSTVSGNLADLTGPGLTNAVDPTDLDNGVAVQWDDHFAGGLGPGGTATFNTAWTFSAFARPQPPPPPPVDNSIDAQLARLPAPQLGKSVNVAPVKGDVFVKLSAKRAQAAQLKAPRGFVALRGAKQIPVGSLLDTRRGTVRLVSAAGGGKRQQGDFSSGFFKTLQSRKGRGLTELRMARGTFSRCASRRRRSGKAQTAARRSRRVVRRLRGNANGRFRTRGRYSAATVRGTDWTVTDRCDGTLTKVKRGSVVVRDIRRRKNVIVRAGRSRLVRAPG